MAVTLQTLLTFGLNFQLPTENATPFQSPFRHALRLNENLPPLTHFQIPHFKSKTYETFKMNLTDLKQNLRKEKTTILPVDKGTGLVIITKNP